MLQVQHRPQTANLHPAVPELHCLRLFLQIYFPCIPESSISSSVARHPRSTNPGLHQGLPFWVSHCRSRYLSAWATHVDSMNIIRRCCGVSVILAPSSLECPVTLTLTRWPWRTNLTWRLRTANEHFRSKLWSIRLQTDTQTGRKTDATKTLPHSLVLLPMQK